MAKNRKIFKQIVRHEYRSKCNVLYIYQWIHLGKLYKLMGSFFSNFEQVFKLLTEKGKIFK